MDFIALQRAKLHYVFENIFHVVERLVSEKEAKMNKIFKVIWSKSKQCYVVVSELAKNTTGKKKIVVASIFAALMAGQAMQVEAGGSFGGSGPISPTGIAISGGTSKAEAKGDNSVAIGRAKANSNGAVAIGSDTESAHNAFSAGFYSKATGDSSIAIGAGFESTGNPTKAVKASGKNGIAIGLAAQSTGESAIAFGTDATASETSATAVGKSAEASGSEATSFGVASTANKDGALAIGSHSTSSVKAGTSIGYNASVSYSGAGDSWGATAIGAQTSVTGKNAVAIGRASKASGNNSLAIGAGNNDDGTASTEFAESTGTNSLAIGYNAKAKNISAVAVGKGAKAEGVASTALGETALADHDNDSALGNSVHASGGGSSAVGYLVTTSGNQAFGAGSNTTVSGGAAIGIGYMNSATGNRAISIGADNSGTNNTASGNYSVAIGAASQATNTNSTAVGTNSNATGEDSFAGASGKASGAASIAIGKSANAGGTTAAASSIAIGDNAAASGIGSTAVGKTALADTGNDSAFGNSSHASGGGSSAIGYLVTTSGNQAFGAGSNTTVSGTAAVGIGYSNEVTGDRAVAIGSSLNGVKTGASGTYGVAMGAASRALAEAATAIGKNTTSNGADSIAIGTAATSTTAASSAISVGKNAKTEDQNAVAIGVDSYAKTMDSIAIGNTAKATGLVSTALGARAEALGTSAVAVGINAKAKKDQATALGFNAQANETNSLALGYGASATVDNGVALGSGSKANVASGVAGYNANTENIARTDKYSGLTGVALNSNLGALSVGVTDATGAATSTRQIVGVAAGTADTDAVNVAQLKSVNLAFTGNSGSGDVNLSKSKLAVEGGTNSFITTTAANKKLEINTTQGTLKNTSGTVSVNGANGLAVAQNVADVINQSNADQTIKYKANGTGNNSVKLSDGLNFTNGTTTTATVGANGQVSFDLNTATQKSITDSAAAVARSISLGGDTGTTTAKSLSSANVNFGIKSGSPTYLTTVANGNDVTLTINEQAIKDAAKSASSFKVKANATVAEDVKGGDTVVFNNGDNIAITQTGKTFKIATAPNVKFDTAIIGTNTTIGSTGVSTNKVTVGNISIDGTGGINAGGKAITNVGTGRVSNSSTDDGNVANIGDVKAIANNAVANLSTELGITDGTTSGTSTVNLKTEKLKVVGTGVAKATVNGQTITVDVAKGTLTNNTTTGALTGTAGVVDANDMATAVNTAITKAVDTATGTQKLDISAGGTDSSVNLKTQKLTVAGTGAATASLTGQTITVNVAEGTFTNKSDGTTSATAGVAKATDVAAAINNANTVLGNKITAATQSLSTLGDNKFKLTADSTSTTGQALNKSGGLSFKIAGDGDLVSTSATTDTINVTVKKGILTNAADGSLNVTNSGVVTADNMKNVVNDAITKAVTSAKDGSAWNISTNGGTATKVSGGNTVDLAGGDNIEITQNSADGKKITVKTKKNLTLDSVTAANTVKVGSGTNLITLDGSTGAVSGNTFTAGSASMNTTGFRLTGGPSVTTTGIDAGNKVITNVASGGTTSTNAANIGDVNDKVTSAINDLTTNLTKNTSISYTANNDTPVKTVSLKDGFKFTDGTLTTAEVAANGVVKFNVTQGSLSTDGNGNITNTAGVATTDDVKTAVNTAITKAVDNATSTQKLDISAGGTDSSVNLKTQKLTVAGTGAAKATVNGQTITVDVAKGTIAANSTTGALTGTAGVVDANDMATAVNTAITKAVDNATGTQALNLTDGTNTGSVKLSTQTLSVSGTNGVQATVGGQGITIGLDTATKNLISNSSTAVDTLGKNTFTLKADSTDTSAQNLNKSGGLAFKVAGDGDLVSTSATTDAVKVTVKKGTLSTNADGTINKATDGVVTTDNMTTVVNDAITKAVTSAKDGSAWNISTNGGTATKVSGGNTVDLINGDNIEITQDGTDGKKITVKTKKDLTLDSVTAANTVKVGSGTNLITLDGTSGAVSGNTFTGTTFTAGAASMNATGFRLTGGPSVTTTGIDAGSAAITNVASGGTTGTNAANIADVKQIAKDTVTNAVNNLSSTLTVTDGTTDGNVSLKTDKLKIVGTGAAKATVNGQTITVDVAKGTIAANSTTGALTGTAGVVDANDMAAAVNTAITKAVDNATGTQSLNLTDGTNTGSVKLSTQTLSVSGTNGVQATVGGQDITIGLDTATKNLISNSSTAVDTLGKNTFTLKADSTDTTAQALNKSGGLAFKVAGDGDLVSTSATTDTVNVTIKKGTLSTNADGTINKATDGVVTTDNMTTVVNDAITKAVTSAKDGSAWNISTNGGTATKVSGGNTVDLINGDNIEITQDGTDGKKITVKTKKDLTLDSVTAANTVKVGSGTNLITLDGTSGAVSANTFTGNTFTAGNASMNTTGFHLTGGPSVTTTGIDAGNKVITNVASGGTTSTNAANIGDVNDKVTSAINNLTTNLTKNTSISYTANNDTPVKTVSLNDGFKFTNGTLTTAEVAAGGVVKFNVTQGTLSTDTNGNITNTTGVATTDDVKNAVNTAITKAVDNATGTQKLDISAGGTDSSVNLKTQKLTVAGTGASTASLNGQTITVDVAKGTLAANSTTGALTGTAGVVDANDMATAVNTAITKAVDNATGTQALNLTDGTNTGSVKLSTQTLSVSGTNGVEATVGGQGITIGLDTATKNLISNSSTAVDTLGKNTFTLKADSTDTTAQALNKSGGLAFKVAGDGDLVSTSATTDTVKVTVKKGELSNAADGSLNVTDSGVVTADNMKTVVNDAITKAVTSAKDGSAWNISTNGGTATKVSGGNTVDLINGDNIEITQDGTDGKKITVKTKKDLTLDSVTAANTIKVGSGTNLITLDGATGGVSGNTFTAGNASMNTTGFRLTGGPSVTTTGIDAGNKVITNVASGGTTSTNAANIGDITKAISDLTTNLTKNTTIAYTANTATPGQTVSLKDGFNFSNGTLTTAEVAANGVVKFNVTQGSLSTDGNGNITNTAGVATTDDVKNAVNTAINKAVTNSSTAVNTLGANTFTLKADSTDTTAQNLNKSGGLAFKVAGDGNFITTSAATDTVTVSIKQGAFGSNADGTAKSTTNGVATTDKVADIVNTTVSNAVNNVTSNQNLKIGGDTTAANSAVNLKNDTLSVKGDNKFISTAASGNDITLTVNEQAIKDAAKDASSFKVKANSTAAEDVKGGDTVAFNDGDNIAITQTGKTFKIATAKNVTFDAATIGGNTTIESTGVTTNKVTVGGISIDGTNGINAGSKQITNVASGGTTATNAANIGDVDTKVTTAINDLTTNLTKNTNIAYTANTATPGQTVSLKDGFNFTNGTLTTAEVAAGGVVKFNVTQGSLSTDANGNITNTAGVATTDDVKNAVNTAINKAVTNSSAAVNTLGANTFTLTGDNSTSTTGQALNKNGGLSFKVAGDGNFITTSAATDTVTVSIKQGTFGSNTDGTAKSTTNGVATTNDVANIVNTTVTNAVTKATGSQVLNITDGTNNGSINLKNDALKVVGADGVTTEVSGKTITVGLDTATKNKINNASTAANRNISLAADSGTTSSQSLKDGDVSFAVKGATGDYISTNMNGSTVEISTKRATINSNAATGEASVTGNDGLATAKNVADAINAATAKAVSQSAWKIAADGTTGTETISGGDTVNFKAGSNMEVSRTGKDITYKTKDNVAFTTVTAGTGANEVKLDGNTGTVTAKDITATGDVTAKNVTTSGNVTAAGTVKGDTVQGNTVKAGNVTITGGTTNTITGLSNTTWTGSTTTPDRAATEGQLQQAISSATSSATFKFDGDNNSQQTMNLQNGTFKVTGDTMITTNATSAGIGLSLNTNNVKIAYASNGLNGQTTSIASGLNFTDGDHTKATVAASGVVKYDAKTSTISVANGHAAASGNDLATADNVADAINQMTQNNSGNTTQLRQEISKVATETQRVGAHAAAMAALKPIQYDPLAPTQIMAGVGNYRGESAAALGIAHYTNDNTMFNVGVSVGGNHNMINAGVTHKFGISAEKKNIPDRYKAGPISSIYVMQDEMTQLRSENEAYKAKLDKQQSEIDALKAAVDQLLASKA